jgi:hypothetical protein
MELSFDKYGQSRSGKGSLLSASMAVKRIKRIARSVQYADNFNNVIGFDAVGNDIGLLDEKADSNSQVRTHLPHFGVEPKHINLIQNSLYHPVCGLRAVKDNAGPNILKISLRQRQNDHFSHERQLSL